MPVTRLLQAGIKREMTVALTRSKVDQETCFLSPPGETRVNGILKTCILREHRQGGMAGCVWSSDFHLGKTSNAPFHGMVLPLTAQALEDKANLWLRPELCRHT